MATRVLLPLFLAIGFVGAAAAGQSYPDVPTSNGGGPAANAGGQCNGWIRVPSMIAAVSPSITHADHNPAQRTPH